MKFCSLVSGSSGNALFVEYKNTQLLIDCGISARRVEHALMAIGKNPSQLSGVLITHEHSDHVSGLRVFAGRHKLPVYASPATLASLPALDPSLMRPAVPGKSFEIGHLSLLGFEVPHDASCPMGYSLFAGEKKLSVATDMGKITEAVAAHLRGSSLVFLESNHDVDMLMSGPYPYYLKQRILSESGHLSNFQAAKLAAALARTGTKQIMLGHLSEKNNEPSLAHDEVAAMLCAQGAQIGGDIFLSVALRDTCSAMTNVG